MAEYEIRHVALTRQDCEHAGIAHLWDLTAPESEEKALSDATIVDLIRQRTALWRYVRALGGESYFCEDPDCETKGYHIHHD